MPKVDRMLAAHGLEHRAPLFDERMLHLSMALPASLKLRDGVEKIVLKRAYANDLPASVVQRPKSGMRVPVHMWFLRDLKAYAHQLLLSPQCLDAGIFEAKRIRELLAYDARRAPGRYGLRLWMLMTFELWRQHVQR